MTEMKKEFKVNSVSLYVVMNFEEMRKVLDIAENEWEDGRFTAAWTINHGNVKKEDYMDDIQSMRDLLQSYEQDLSRLEEHIINVRKKKNGEFWKGSVVTIRYLEYVSEYYTDFTNSWNVLQLRLKVLDNHTSNLELIYQFETN